MRSIGESLQGCVHIQMNLYLNYNARQPQVVFLCRLSAYFYVSQVSKILLTSALQFLISSSFSFSFPSNIRSKVCCTLSPSIQVQQLPQRNQPAITMCGILSCTVMAMLWYVFSISIPLLLVWPLKNIGSFITSDRGETAELQVVLNSIPQHSHSDYESESTEHCVSSLTF